MPNQVLRFALFGCALNLAAYLGFLGLVAIGMPLRAAMTVTYVAGMLSGFALNRRFTFRQTSSQRGPLVRYIAAYALGYATNFLALWAFAERLGYSHALVQAVMTVTLAGMLFLLQKYWVFAASRSNAAVQGRLG